MIEEKLGGVHLELVEKAQRLAREKIRDRAEDLDKRNAFPEETFADLHREGLTRLCVPKAQGGWGLGPDGDDALPVWLVTKTIAAADSSTSHCQQVHNNTCHCVGLMGTEDQKERFLRPVVDEGAVFGFWGSEQSGQPPTGGRHQLTLAKKVKGGREITGTKYYCTNAGAARYGVVFVYPEEAEKPLQNLLLAVVDCRSSGVKVEPEWWDHATGMRSTVSHKVVFDRVFVPDEDFLGEPGDYWTMEIQARYLPQFSANFVGTATGVFDYYVQYLKERKRPLRSPHNQHYVAEARILLVTMDLMLEHVAALYRERRMSEAFHASRMLRAYCEESARSVIELMQRCGGSSITMKPHPTERVLRDWNFYCRHESVDLIYSAIGREELGIMSEVGPAQFGFA